MPLNKTVNINGARNKIDLLYDYINDHNPDIIILNETKLSENVQLHIPNYTIVRKDISNHKGGVLIAVASNLPFTQTLTEELKFDQALSIVIHLPDINNPLHIMTYYNPPRNNLNQKAKRLSDSLSC